ncbi:MAG: hypothetical protein DWQ53_05735 [Microcystis flos-aquae DF17]|nr:hypothetical protein [Microcystis sp. M53598_WE2]REJ48440.1 MAG: hypothetical protein DWQ53_05735 [Microcystis flos-aquae DF17]
MVSHDYYLNFRVIRYIFAFYSVVRIREIGVRSQDSGDRSQESGDRRLFLFILPTLHTPYPTTPHPTPQFPR